MKDEKKLILIGVGPHTRRIYYPLLEKYSEKFGIRIPLVVELKEQENKIRNYLVNRKLQPDKLIFIDTENRHGESMDRELLLELNRCLKEDEVSGIIIATEPKAHKIYAIWALEHNVDILMDKPLTSPMGSCTDMDAANRIYADYLELENLLEKSKSNFVIQCQRQEHEGYKFIKRYLENFVTEFQIPITYLDCYHADGSWYMPNELFGREGHPYKYGYGKMMHSGYHFLNLFTWLLEENNKIVSKKPNFLSLFVKSSRSYDFLHQIDNDNYYHLFNTNQYREFFTPESKQKAREFGEIDVSMLLQSKRHDIAITTASINLLSNSFSRRSWTSLPEDTYKGNGRIRHERVTIQIPALLNIQVHSYQSHEVNKRDIQTEGAGNEHHFDIYIFRNSDLVGGNTLEKFSIGEGKNNDGDIFSKGLQEKARETYFLDFLEGRKSTSHFASHSLTVKLLATAYKCMVKEYNGDIPYISFNL